MSRPLKILLGVNVYRDLTGSELYVYVLAKFLKKLNHEVHIATTHLHPGSIMVRKAAEIGVPVYHDFPKFDYDIIYSAHFPMTQKLLATYKDVPFVMPIHSELGGPEVPVVDPRVKKYIAIRPPIKEMLINNFNIPCDDIFVIYNPFDTDRFNTNYTKQGDPNVLLFVGTIDPLRENTIHDLVDHTKREGKELWLLGETHGAYRGYITASHVKHFRPTWDVESYVKKCGETAGILLGRTTIEGWLCGKPGWIYDVNERGEIKSKKLHAVPDDIDKFKGENVAQQIVKVLESCL